MSMYAFTDVTRKDRLLANEAVDKDRGIRYYCPNPKCNAKMYVWNFDGETKTYFQSAGKPGHVEHCPYGSENNFNSEKCKEDGFSPNTAIANLLVPNEMNQTISSKINERRENSDGKADAIIPHTIRQIYDMCKAHYCTDLFNGYQIGQILVDSRSMFMYPKGVYRYRLVEAKCKKHLYDKKSIFLVSSITDGKYEFELKFTDMYLLAEIKQMLFPNMDKVIVVAGNWEKSGVYGRFSTIFASKRQIKVLRRVIES